MTREELVEKVARSHAKAVGLSPDEVNARWKAYVPAARAAIDIVLEEAAKVAEQTLVYANTLAEADKAVPAAIRALGKE